MIIKDYLDIFDTFRLKNPNVFDWDDLDNALKYSIKNQDNEYLKFIFDEIDEPLLTRPNYAKKYISWVHKQDPIDIDDDPDELNTAINEIIVNDNFDNLKTYWSKYKNAI